MHEFPVSIAMINGTSFFLTVQLDVHKRRSRQDSLVGW